MVDKTKAITEGSRENVKAPSRHVSCESSAALWLFKQ